MCFGFANEIPKTVHELDLMTKDAHLQSTLRDQKSRENSNCLYSMVKKKGWW